MPDFQTVIDLAQHLMSEGYFDDEADARLAAIKIIHAAERSQADDEADDAADDDG